MRKHRLGRGTAGLTLIGILFSGCSSSTPQNKTAQMMSGGLLSVLLDPTTICKQLETDGPVTIGVITVAKSLGRSLTFDDVRLIDPKSIDLLGSKLVPNPGFPGGGSAGVGSAQGFPPSAKTLKELSQDWTRAVDTVGATTTPSTDNDLTVGVRLSNGQNTGSSDGVFVRYHLQDGSVYEETLPLKIDIRLNKQKCVDS